MKRKPTPKRRATRKTRVIAKCQTCKVNPADSLHVCPYQEDVNNDPNPRYCNCCADCRNECAQDI